MALDTTGIRQWLTSLVFGHVFLPRSYYPPLTSHQTSQFRSVPTNTVIIHYLIASFDWHHRLLHRTPPPPWRNLPLPSSLSFWLATERTTNHKNNLTNHYTFTAPTSIHARLPLRCLILFCPLAAINSMIVSRLGISRALIFICIVDSLPGTGTHPQPYISMILNRKKETKQI